MAGSETGSAESTDEFFHLIVGEFGYGGFGKNKFHDVKLTGREILGDLDVTALK